MSLREEYDDYVLSVKRRLARLRSNSRQFWSLTKKILLSDSSCSDIPILKDDSVTGLVFLVKRRIYVLLLSVLSGRCRQLWKIYILSNICLMHVAVKFL